MSQDTSFAAPETHTPEATKSVAALKQLAFQVRRDILRMVHAVSSGHLGGSPGCTELLDKLLPTLEEVQLLLGRSQPIMVLTNTDALRR